jgi:drug/metabolite transporter (DMT)-like permease
LNASSAWVFLAVLAGSIEPILVKLGYRGGVAPMQLLVMKTAVAAIVILPLTRRVRIASAGDFARIATVSALLLLTTGFTYFSLQRLSAVTVITLVTVTPALVALVNQARGRDRLSRCFWIGFSMCFGGVVLTLDALNPTNQSMDMLGLVLAGGAVVCSTTYRVLMEDLTRAMDPRLISTWIFWINALVVVACVGPFIDPIPASALPIGLWIGVSAALANIAFLWAIKLVGSTNMSIFNLVQRPLVIVTAALVLQEPFSLIQSLGVALVLVGIPLARATRL